MTNLQSLKLGKFSRLAQPISYCQKQNRSKTVWKGIGLSRERGWKTDSAAEITIRRSISLIRKTKAYKRMGLRVRLHWFHLSGPGNRDAIFYGLVSRTFLGVHSKSPLSLFPPFGRDLHLVSKADLRDFQNSIYILNVSFHVSGNVVRGRDSPRIQRSG